MKTVSIKLTEYEAQTVLKLFDYVIDVINDINAPIGKERMLPVDPLGIGLDNYINIANQIEEVLEDE